MCGVYSQIFDVPGAKDFLLSCGFVETDDALATHLRAGIGWEGGYLRC